MCIGYVHVNGVSLLDSHYIFVCRIPDTRGCCSRFQTKTSWRQQNGSGFPKRFIVCLTWFFGDCSMSEAGSVSLTVWHTRYRSGKPLPVCCCHGWHAWNVLTKCGTVAIYRKTQTDASGIARKHRHLLWSTTLANGRKRLDQHHLTY